ncbi:hypothetical protein KP509_38G040200 [Ceratopteris richardii]|uniref:HAT C-terminal dimerisation domain-containing protein n=1 Tax=Ceratopteris richardii TaxID=49495 RepID=A0A8T2Q4A3_CERRI|nr:hypothetical protein KP509_38G040200 [Ceratopteris richardii]
MSTAQKGFTMTDYNKMCIEYVDKVKKSTEAILKQIVLDYVPMYGCIIALDGWISSCFWKLLILLLKIKVQLFFGRISIQNKYEGITWVPCIAHTLNLLLKDIGRLYFIKQSLLDANHAKYPSYRVATSKCMSLIQSQSFWHNLEKIIDITKPFFVIVKNYWIMSEAIQKVEDFNQFSLRGKTQIILLVEKRWRQMHTHLHGPTFVKDPAFQLNGCYGDLWHIEAIQKHPPPIWWKEYIGEAVELQHIAMRVLLVIASSSNCECNWSTYDFLHSKQRNCLRVSHANDLVYLFLNMHLLHAPTKIASTTSQQTFSDFQTHESLTNDSWIHHDLDGDHNNGSNMEEIDDMIPLIDDDIQNEENDVL